MIKRVDITNPELVKDILNVQTLAYKVEADIIGSDDIPPLQDTVESLQQCGERFYGYYVDERLCGVISIKQFDNVVDIHRLMVHPKYFRQGIAQQLLDFVENNAEKDGIIIVSTGTKNKPAVSFYLKNGFLKIEEKRVAENLSLTTFIKKI